MTVLQYGESNCEQPTIITDKSYELLLHDEQQSIIAINYIKYIFIGISVVSFSALIGKYAYELYYKTKQLEQMLRLKDERDARNAALQQRKKQRKQQNNAVVESDCDIDDSEINLCVICTVNKANCVFVECFHQCCCVDCSEQLMKRGYRCPICRSAISRYRIPIIV
jgi:hypothetical protein